MRVHDSYQNPLHANADTDDAPPILNPEQFSLKNFDVYKHLKSPDKCELTSSASTPVEKVATNNVSTKQQKYSPKREKKSKDFVLDDCPDCLALEEDESTKCKRALSLFITTLTVCVLISNYLCCVFFLQFAFFCFCF